eukprot:Hpha_TRINITY_DN1235_c0_g1::TRINITY_DN1235_c0_g1_i1::g.44722::m.44722
MGCCCGRPAQEKILEDALIKSINQENATSSNADRFQQPARPIGVSGGTAAFYSILFKDDKARGERSRKHWIGKDLAHAADELGFYERARRLLTSEPENWALLKFMFEYGGVVDIDAQVGKKVETRRMLLLRNLFDGAGRLRLLDIKIGSVTAVGGWQGKGRINAVRNRTIDQATNSHVEGFRTEGFEQAPDGLSSLLEAAVRDRLRGAGGLDRLTGGLIDVHVEFSAGKKGKRLALQKLQAAEFLTYWSQMRPETPTLGTLTGNEVAALAFQSATRSVVSLVVAAASMRVPQQWIGSSIALGYDIAARPARDDPPPSGVVNIFDWGRSELTTRDMWESLPDKERRERTAHWKEWVGGVLRLGFEMCRAYRRQYCPKGGKWRELKVKVWSYSQELVGSVTSGTPLGVATLPLQAVSEMEVALSAPDTSALSHITHAHRHAIRALGGIDKAVEAVARGTRRGGMKLTISILGPVHYPQGSVFREGWVIKVHSASNLPKLDVLGWCTPVVSVALVDEVGAEASAHTTVERGKQGGATWEPPQAFEFCAASEDAASSVALLGTELLERAPGVNICDWDLAASGGCLSLHDQAGNKQAEKMEAAALRAFRDAFFLPFRNARGPGSPIRRESWVAFDGELTPKHGTQEPDGLADALEKLAIAEQKNSALETELKQLQERLLSSPRGANTMQRDQAPPGEAAPQAADSLELTETTQRELASSAREISNPFDWTVRTGQFGDPSERRHSAGVASAVNVDWMARGRGRARVMTAGRAPPAQARPSGRGVAAAAWQSPQADWTYSPPAARVSGDHA